MKIIIILISLFTPLFLSAQTTISWKGGTPGKESAWNEARNWDQNRLPNENDHVIIRPENNGHFAQPIIDSEIHVAWVEIHVGSSLSVTKNGKLLVDGEHTYSEGISIYGGDLASDGEIILKDINVEFIAAMQPVCLSQKITYYSTLHGYEFCVVSSEFSK